MSVSDIGVQLRRVNGWLPAGIDRVWLAIGLLLLAVAAIDADQGIASARFAVDAMIDIAPFLLLAIAVAAYAKASGTDNLIAAAFRGSMTRMIVAAALIGGLSPFCSCGVIPLIAAMLAMGVPLPPVMAFWLASPVMDPSMFMLTTATLGLPFAVAKTVAAVSLGLFGGFGAMAVERLGGFTEPLREGVGNGGCGGGSVRNPRPVRWQFWREADRWPVFARDALSNLKFLGKWLALAFVLESLMLAYVPAESIASAVGGSGILPVIVATLVGVPAYLNGYAALPLVGGLMDGGMSAGAGMAFLVAGGVSSIPAAIAVFALVRHHVFAAYIGFALVGSMAIGLAWGFAAPYFA
jgi:uncharacterized membrane protein YraQ (UPF0718 family)